MTAGYFRQLRGFRGMPFLEKPTRERNRAQEQQTASGAELVDLRAQIADESTVLPMAHHVVSPQSFQDILCFHEAT